VEARWLLTSLQGEKVAVLETSQACGLSRLSAEERNPVLTGTQGVGELILKAIEAGVSILITGIGGSGTNDGGAGMAEALGYRFYDETGQLLRAVPKELARCVRVEKPAQLILPRILVASDVVNPLLGIRGATRVYGPQKGLQSDQIEPLEEILKRLSQTVIRDCAVDLTESSGAGAAGGLGWGLMTFCGAQMESGFSLIARVTGLEDRIRQADFVVTGEGSLDGQTLEGKTPHGVAGLAKKQGKPVFAVAGRILEEEKLEDIFDALMPIATRPMTLEESCASAADLLQQAGKRMGHWIRVRV